MDYRKIAEEIYTLAGPRENILSVTNCMTRLRLQLATTDPDMLNKISSVEGVMGINNTESELQIILGPGRANHVTSEFRTLWEKDSAQNSPRIGDGKELHDEIRARNATPVKLFFKRIASIFIPLIPAFIACGLLTGCFMTVFKFFPEAAAHPALQLLALGGNTIFWGLNLFVGWNTAKEFGGTPIIGGILAVLISHPGLANITLMGDPLVPGRGGIISVLLAGLASAWLEQRIRRVVPEIMDLFLTPFLTFIIVGAGAILILQPIGGAISSAIGHAAIGAVSTGGAITGAALGGMWLPIVMMGMHQPFTPIHAELLATYGVTILLPILAMAGAGQVGASIAVYLKTKNRFLKKTIAGALPAGILGVGEPLIYGVTLPLGRPFVAACIGGAFGGAVQATFGVGAYSMGVSGLPLAAVTDQVTSYLTGLAVAYIAGFAAAWLIGFDDPE